LLEATERYAAQLEELPDGELATRAIDVRELGRRSARLLTGAAMPSLFSRPTILVARDLGPADIVELALRHDSTHGIALAAGSVFSHVAVMARALNLPLVVGLGDDLMKVKDGEPIVLDGDRGEVVLGEDGDFAALIDKPAWDQKPTHEDAGGSRPSPLVTRDGRPVTLLCNAANEEEAVAGLAAGAEGIGLLRTEFAFLRADCWPTRLDHESVLRSTLAVVHGRVATVRTLDFGYDKLPPFLAGTVGRGLALMLAHPEALQEQMRAILTVGADSRLRVLFPFVESVDELREARLLLSHVAREIDQDASIPPVGAMIETPEAAEKAGEIAAASDFLAIGTNDLVRHLLAPNDLPGASLEMIADPRVLSVVASIVEVAHADGLPVEICGEAAGLPSVLPLFVGLGVDELSVAPARLQLVRLLVHKLVASEASAAMRSVLAAASINETLRVAAELLASAQRVQKTS
jgi:phosphoenolpyruvate-protein kinase (PTS system EI component)